MKNTLRVLGIVFTVVTVVINLFLLSKDYNAEDQVLRS